MKKFGEKLARFLVMLLSISYYIFAIMLILGYRYSEFPWDLPIGEHYLLNMGLMAIYFGGCFINITIHEAGHVIFGLLTGYRFQYFRVGGLMWVKRGKWVELCRYSLPGTGGQCGMSPPLDREKKPCILFNLGGCIMNLIAGILCWVLCLGFRDDRFLLTMFFVWMLDNFHAVLLNGIPLKVAVGRNDGGNAWLLWRKPEQLAVVWNSMDYTEALLRGDRLKDMPEAWFRPEDGAETGSEELPFYSVARCVRLLDRQEFPEADAAIAELLEVQKNLSPMQRGLMELERVYIELMGENRPEEIKKRMTKLVKQVRKTMRNSPSVIRMEYALALLDRMDEKKAAKYLKQFDKVAKNYPYLGDLATERAQLEAIRERAKAIL